MKFRGAVHLPFYLKILKNRGVEVIEIHTIDNKLKGGLKIKFTRMAPNLFGLFLI